MDKLDFVIKNKEVIKFSFQGNDMLVTPFISEEIKLDLAKKYINFMYHSDNLIDNYFSAEWSIILGIMESCTNVKITDKNAGKNIELQTILASGLWNEVKNKIENYQEFKNDLRLIFKSVNDERALEKSVGQALDKISNKVIEFIDKIGNVDLSQEGVAKLVNGLNTEIQTFKEKFPMSEAKIPQKEEENKTE